MEEKTKEKFLFHDTVISWACIIWAIASMGLMFYFSGLNQVTFAIMTFGQLFLIMGIIAICRKQLTGMIFTITGLGCVIIPAINEWGYLFNNNISSNSIFPIMLSTAITILGLAMMFTPGILEDMAERRCKLKVKAELFDFKTIKLNDGQTAYAPVYKYEYNGKKYEKCINRYKRNQTEVVGTKMDIRINESNPEEVYIETTKASKMLIYIFGASFFMSGLGMLITILAEI